MQIDCISLTLKWSSRCKSFRMQKPGGTRRLIHLFIRSTPFRDVTFYGCITDAVEGPAQHWQSESVSHIRSGYVHSGFRLASANPADGDAYPSLLSSSLLDCLHSLTYQLLRGEGRANAWDASAASVISTAGAGVVLADLIIWVVPGLLA